MKHLYKQSIRILCVFVCVLFLVSNSTYGTKGKKGPKAPATNVTAELNLMMWSGDNRYWLDIGGQNLRPNDLMAQNVAACYATAKEFKKLYPNIKINLYAKTEGPDDHGPWAQHRENFRMEYGVYPDIYSANDMIGDLQKGLIADLSVFANDPMYRSFNPSVLKLMSIDGRLFALPQYLIPWGVFVNKSLARTNRINVPDPDWTIAEFTRFVSNSRPNEFYGIMGDHSVDANLIKTGTQDFTYRLLNRRPGDPYVNINSDATRNLLRFFNQWTTHAVWPNNDQGKISDIFMDSHWWWSYKFFIEGKLLALTGDPWMMGDAAHPDPNHWGSVKAADWDIYPRPSTDYVGNTIGIVLDPFVIRNYAMDDGNPALSDREFDKLQIAWEFLKFWCGDSRAMEARTRQQFRDGDTLKSCLNDSLPMVTGPEFRRQMEIWYMPDMHKRFADRNKMPGFHKVLDIWEKGQFWDVSESAYPWYYDFEGTRRAIPYEWENAWNAEIAGAERFDANWLDRVYTRLADWNTAMNRRWETENRKVQDALNRFYPKR